MVSEQLVRLQLAQEVEEEEGLDVGGVDGSSADDHPSVVILNGIQIEDDQYVCLSLDLWTCVDWVCLEGDLQRISKIWGCTRHPSK